MSNENIAFVRKDMLEELPAPATNKGPLAWVMNNLFSSIGNTIMTLIGIYILYALIPPLVKFVFIDGVWIGSDRNVCASVNKMAAFNPMVGSADVGHMLALIWGSLYMDGIHQKNYGG
jgi:hypothetical protein